MEFFQEQGVSISMPLIKHILTTDNKRIRKSDKNNQNRQMQIERKALDRKKSIAAQINTSEYDAGGF